MAGYLGHKQPQEDPLSCPTQLQSTGQDTQAPVAPPAADLQLTWKDLSQLLKQKLTSEVMDSTLR